MLSNLNPHVYIDKTRDFAARIDYLYIYLYDKIPSAAYCNCFPGWMFHEFVFNSKIHQAVTVVIVISIYIVKENLCF